MGIIQGASPVPETYAGPAKVWWDPAKTKSAVFLERDMSGDEVLRVTGLHETVSKRRLRGEDLDGHVDDATPTIPEWVSLQRNSDGAFMGMVTPSYHTFQYAEMVEMTDKVLELGDGALAYHTGGTLYDGRLGFILAKFSESMVVKGDDAAFESYLLAITGHTGRHALQFCETDVRVICGNTADMAVRGSSNKVSLRHTSGMGDRTEEVQRALGLVVKHRETLQEFLNDLADRPMTIEAFKKYTEVLIPFTPGKDEEKQVKTVAKRDALTDLFANSVTMTGLPFTAYRALQATIEWTDQKVDYRTTKKMSGADREALAVIEGPAWKLKTTAARLLVKA